MSGTLTTGQLILTDAKYNGDGFGRIRVSEPMTLFEVEHIYNKQTDFIGEIVSATATSTFMNNLSSVEMETIGAGNVVRQSYEYIPYQPGKSKINFLSGVLSVGDLPANTTTRIGTFDSALNKTAETTPIGNGHFFEMVGNATPSNVVVNVVERSYYSSSQSWGYENRVPQSSWNIDKLDGTGVSGKTVDFKKVNIFVIEIQWLGVGNVRMGVALDNVIYYCHQFTIAERQSITFDYNGTTYNLDELPYMQYGKLPIRYEINTTSGSGGKMRMICATSISEGGFIPYGLRSSYSSPSAISLGSSYAAIFAIRLKTANPRATLKLLKYSLFFSGKDDIVYWKLILNPTLNSPLTWGTLNSYSEIAAGASTNTVTGGTEVASGAAYSDFASQNVSVNETNLSLLPTIYSNIAGTPDVLVMAAKTAGTLTSDYFVQVLEII